MSIIHRDLDMTFALTPYSAEELIPTGVRYGTDRIAQRLTQRQADAWSMLCPARQLPETVLSDVDMTDETFWTHFLARLATDMGEAVRSMALLQLRAALDRFTSLGHRDGGPK